MKDKLENYLVSISLDYPKFEQNKKCYLYELFYFDEIKNKVNLYEEDRIKYNIINGELSPFYLKISDNTFNQLSEYLLSETEYEENQWQDDVSLLNAILGIYRQDIKNWEV